MVDDNFEQKTDIPENYSLKGVLQPKIIYFKMIFFVKNCENNGFFDFRAKLRADCWSVT